MVHLLARLRLNSRSKRSTRKSADTVAPVVFGKQEEKHRNPCFDFIRGIMVLWVFVVHISLNGGICKFGEIFPCRSVFCWLSFYMATFYCFSGYLLRCVRTPRDTFIKGIRLLLLPCATMTVFGLVVYTLDGPIPAPICHVGRYSLFFFGLHLPILNYVFDPLFNQFFASSASCEYLATALIFLLFVCSLAVRFWKRVGISGERRMVPL